MPTSTLTSKGQVTIPKEVRDRLGLQTGDRIIFRFDETGRLLLESAVEDPIADISGFLRHLAPDQPVTVEQMREGIRRRAARKLRPK